MSQDFPSQPCVTLQHRWSCREESLPCLHVAIIQLEHQTYITTVMSLVAAASLQQQPSYPQIPSNIPVLLYLRGLSLGMLPWMHIWVWIYIQQLQCGKTPS